ncbi:F-box/WD repeat-containing protein 2-like [Uloborus diversus]|uniref:F-box/WD repeat-containing protein 2-like n=1 Tax=Uloborus diversus TaxID=327109 RepID=UPI0024094EFE|nr:F-box/WD repeat-containing protein 2-like [Uloborus diversus]
MATKSDGDFEEWLQNVVDYYSNLSDVERNLTIDCIIACSGSSQLLHLHSQTKALLHRDFLKLLPAELREHLLSYLDGKSLLTCCCVSKTWNQVICSSSRVWQQACLRSGLVICKYLDNIDAKYWKSFYVEMARRRHQMITQKCFNSKTYDRNLRRVTAVHYYKSKVATASDSKIIQIWDCAKDQCLITIRTDASIASIKFDDNIIIASSYLGHMVSWDAVSGERLAEYMRHGGAVFTFDYSQDLNVVISGAADCRIKIWALSNGFLYKTLTDHNWWVLKVMLTPYPAEKGSKQQNRHLIFSMDKTTVVVRLMSFVAETITPEGLYMTTLYSILLGRSDDICLFTPGLHFDGDFLYFPKESFDNRGCAVLCKWDVKRKCMISEMELNLKVKALLGVGKKYLVVLTPWQDKTTPNFIVMDKESKEKVALWHLPPSKPSTPDCAQLCLGEKDWLDGLDGNNDQGVLLTAATDDNSVYVLKWSPRSNGAVT